MPQVSINKNNVFGNFAKILALLDENPQIKLTYSVDGDSDREVLEKAAPIRGAFGREKPIFSRDKVSTFGERRTSTFGEKRPFTKGKTFTKRESFDSVETGSETKRTPRTPAYKSTKFKAEKRGTAPEVTNKKGNAGKGYKRAGY